MMMNLSDGHYRLLLESYYIYWGEKINDLIKSQILTRSISESGERFLKSQSATGMYFRPTGRHLPCGRITQGGLE
jgi:hypothetical protein